MTEKKIEFADKKYNVARIDNFETIVEQVVLIKIIQKETRFAQIQFKRTKKFAEKIKLKRKIINTLSSILFARSKIKQYKILLI